VEWGIDGPDLVVEEAFEALQLAAEARRRMPHTKSPPLHLARRSA
jgi:hypothetical protein